MKISIVSPSYNQAAFIESSIASVASQTYVDKEHIIVDGGSTDGCAEIIRAATARLAHVRAVIEPDRGQADAINKGLRLATGDILAWINTDDNYADPEAFAAIAAEFARHPEADLIYARGRRLDAQKRFIREAVINRRIDGPEALKTAMGVFQPSVFFRRSVFERVGGLSEAYNLQLDYEYWIRMLKAGVRFHFFDRVLAEAVVHEDAKSTRDRLHQLSECISMIEDHYGETPDIWLQRFARFHATRRDEKTARSHELSQEENQRADTTFAVVKAALESAPAPRPRRRIVTSFDSKYFQQGLNLIASVHRTSFASFDEIIVYELGLSAGEKSLLRGLSKVRVQSYPDPAPPGFPDFYEPAGRAYKVCAIAGAGLDIEAGDLMLWMDAGLSACMDVEEIFAEIAAKEFFITDHDDSAFWPFFNVHFLHRGAVEAIGPTKEELLAPHLCSCLIGYAAKGRYQHLIDEAHRLGVQRDAVMWPKVLAAAEKPRNPRDPEENRRYRAQILNDPAALAALTVDDLYARFPFYGHRTQSIYSVLAARMHAPVYSATLFHKSNTASSRAASVNWAKSAHETDKNATREHLDGVTAQTRLYHHRGTYNDLSGLVFARANEPALIVANGPSLRGMDFEQLRGKVWLGMNAAYRFWDEHNLYPHVYVCFDTTVQDSHRDQIKRLIERREEYGIRWFFLRKSFLEFWPEAATLGCVFFLEDLQQSVEWFDRGKITTGSFSLYVLCFLGFSEIYILGVDLNYVEKIDGARVEGRELVITQDVASNPNYFFDGYQRPGDRYNPPNRHPDMHLRSWNEAGEVLSDFPMVVYNCNSGSAVRAFPFVNRDRALQTLESRQKRSLRVTERAWSAIGRQELWRDHFLKRLGQEPGGAFHPSAQQATRLARWIEPSRAPAPLSLPLTPMIDEKPREAHASVDETAVVARLLAKRRGQDHVMLDVGAHHGGSAQYFNKLGWTIHCFEPDPANRVRLNERYANAANITIDSRAVSDKTANGVSFFSSPESTGISGLHAFHTTHHESARVDVTTVTHIVEERRIARVDFLKIDVEGFDFAVLKGVPWDRLAPDVIECEFEDQKTRSLGHTWKDVATFLKQKGYAVYLSEWHPIVRYGVRHDWRRVLPMGADDVPQNAWGNILAFRDDPGLATLKAAFDAAMRPAPAAHAPTAAGKTPPVAPPEPAPPAAAPPTAPEALRFYAPFGDALKQRAPQVFTLARFIKKTLGSLWRRRAVAAPVILLFAAWVLAGFVPAMAAWRWLIWGGAAFAFLFAALTYLALRTRQFMERMISETQALQAALHMAQTQLAAEHAVSRQLAADVALAVKSADAVRKRLTAVQPQLDAHLRTLDTRATDLSDLRALMAASQQQIAGEVDGARRSIAALEAEANARTRQLDARIDTIAAETAKIEDVRAVIDALEANSARQARELNDRAEALGAETARVAQELDAAAKMLQQDVIARTAAAEEQIAALDAVAKRTETAMLAQGEAFAKQAEISEQRIAARADASEKRADTIAEELGALGRDAEALAKESARAAFNNASWYQRFNRRISEEQLHVLKQWAANTPAKPTREAMGYAAHRACMVEQRMQGRLATSIEDVLLRSLAAMSVPRRKINVLEIGTLFGIGAGIMYDMMAPHYDEVHVTLIDPLDGYYETNRLDILTGQPITERTLRQNLAQVDLKGDRLTLIKHLSTDKEALQQAAERRYDVLVIDGDHSYEGVKADFDLYAPMVRRGGIIIFDDYGAKDWPDVARYVDSEVSQVGDVSRIGHEWRTCAYRKRGSSAKKRKRT